MHHAGEKSGSARATLAPQRPWLRRLAQCAAVCAVLALTAGLGAGLGGRGGGLAVAVAPVGAAVTLEGLSAASFAPFTTTFEAVTAAQLHVDAGTVHVRSAVDSVAASGRRRRRWLLAAPALASVDVSFDVATNNVTLVALLQAANSSQPRVADAAQSAALTAWESGMLVALQGAGLTSLTAFRSSAAAPPPPSPPPPSPPPPSPLPPSPPPPSPPLPPPSPPPSPPPTPPPLPPPPLPPSPPPSPPPVSGSCSFTTPGFTAQHWSAYLAAAANGTLTNGINGRQIFGMTWANNTGPCSQCPPNATYLPDRAACECDIYHYGPACALCRPEWDPATCDGSTCAAGYVNGMPPAFDPTTTMVSTLLNFNCSNCDYANGTCRTSWVGSNGAFCAPCSACDPTNGQVVSAGLANATCVCAPRFRGASCTECMPRFTDPAGGCLTCKPGYISSDPNASPPTCDTCDIGAGYCHGATSKPDASGGPAQINMTDFVTGVDSTFAGSTTYFDGTQPLVDLFRLLPDPYLEHCAPCADCNTFYGTVANSSCICRELSVVSWPDRDYNSQQLDNVTSAWGPTCSLQAEAIMSACFPASSRVLTATGAAVRLDAIATGTAVLAQHPTTGALGFSPVVAWWHHESGELLPDPLLPADAQRRFAATRYTRLATASGATLTLSAQHLVPASRHGCAGASYGQHAKLMLPAQVTPGAGLWVLDAASNALACSVVLSSETVFARGAFAPVTAWGTAVVDGVAASSLVAYGAAPLWALRLHHAALVAAHRWLGTGIGGALVDALHAPFYAVARVPQPTAAAVRRALAAPPPGCVDVAVRATAAALVVSASPAVQC